MAAKKEKLTSTKRFGARYGPRSKIAFDKIERLQRARQPCPYCRYIAVRRISRGIWSCRKCRSTFTGRAYVAREEKAAAPEAAEE